MPLTAGYIVEKTSVEYYTPSVYVEAARALMGGIDLDPASCSLANQTVQAARYYSIRENGFLQPWYGCVWLNPPYGKVDGISEQQRWSAKLVAAYEAGDVQQAVLLCNASGPSSKWVHVLLHYPHCFTDHRIEFYSSVPRKAMRALMGSMFVYFGPHLDAFIELFEVFGSVMPPAYPRRKQHKELPFMGITEKE